MRWPGNTVLLADEILVPGDLLGGYRIVAQRGFNGGHSDPPGLDLEATLYRAEEAFSGRQVMLTVFKREHSPDEPFVQRLVSESKHVSAFVHPNIVSVYAAGFERGRLYFATQAIDGDTLLERIRGGGLPAAQALALLEPVAEALDAAHAAGLVHGEITPGAVRIDAAGTPHLAAFDVLRRSPGNGMGGVRLQDINYASPELLCGRGLTRASDIYSLTAVLSHCLTGEVHLPQEPGPPGKRLRAGGRRAPRLRPGAPVLAAVIARGMAKDPADRYQQARALIEDAARAVASVSWGPRRSSPKLMAQRRRVVFGLACAAVAAAGILDAEIGSKAGPAPRTAARVELVSNGPLTIRYRRPWHIATASVPGAFVVAGSSASAPILLTSELATLAAGPLTRSASVPGGVPPQLALRYGRAIASTASIEGAAARRYDWTLPGGRRLVGFVLATSGADLALICSGTAVARRALVSCEQLAQAASVSGIKVLAPGPDAALAAALSHDFAPLGAARGLGTGSLPARSAPASHLARLAREASSMLSGLSPPARSQTALVALRRAVRAEAVALADLGAAAAANDRGAYVLARVGTLTADRSLLSAMDLLGAEGLKPPALPALYVVPPAPSAASSVPSKATAGPTAPGPTAPGPTAPGPTAPAPTAPAPVSQAAAPANPAATAPASSAPSAISSPASPRSSGAPASPTVIVVPTGSGTAAPSATSPSMVVVVPTN